MKRRGVLLKAKDESGIAIIVVLLAIAVVTVIGITLLLTATRDYQSSQSVQRASSALGVAEAGIQHAIQQIKTRGPSQARLSEQVADRSDDGLGRWMNPLDPTSPPLDTDIFVGEVGTTDRYTAYIIEIDPVDLSTDPPKQRGVYRVLATGIDRKDDPTRPGVRTVEQNVRVEALDMPFSLFAKDGANFGGDPIVFDVSLYTAGDIIWRSKVDITGTDKYYGGPAGAHATGAIHQGNGKGGGTNGPIHPPNLNCNFPFDRDTNGGAFTWTCAGLPPSWTSSIFNQSIMESLGIDPDQPGEDTYRFLKELAKASGKYIVHSGNSSLNIQASDLVGLPKEFVLYVDVTGNGSVAIKTGWGPSVNPPQNATCPGSGGGTYDGSFGIIVVRGGNLSWQNNEIWWGAVFIPEGEFSGSGTGQAWLVGTVNAKVIGNSGNVRFQLNDCWKKNATGPFYKIERLRWHEADR